MDKYIIAFSDLQFFVFYSTMIGQGKLIIFLKNFKNIFLTYNLKASIQR